MWSAKKADKQELSETFQFGHNSIRHNVVYLCMCAGYYLSERHCRIRLQIVARSRRDMHRCVYFNIFLKRNNFSIRTPSPYAIAFLMIAFLFLPF